VALGTVELGIDYGIAAAGAAARPSESEAIQLLRQAAEAGINLFDTAPNYGASEQLVGEALGERADCFIATKITIPRDEQGRLLSGTALREAVAVSLVRSAKALRREVIDILQIHNATLPVLQQGELTEVLRVAQRDGRIRWLGASVYTEEEALLAIETGFDAIQVAFSVLDQRSAARVFPAAARAGVGVLGRSALLKGVLSQRALVLPERLAALRRAAEAVKVRWQCDTWTELTQKALRYCMFDERLHSVLVGLSSASELRELLEAHAAGPLDAQDADAAASLAISNPVLVNPANWELP
jgi:aryl-alcohol dehydrogenase-like predicted oxidoreductase